MILARSACAQDPNIRDMFNRFACFVNLNSEK